MPLCRLTQSSKVVYVHQRLDRQKKQINNTDNMAPMVINSDTQEYSNLHLYGDTQSEEHRMRVNSMRKGSSLHVAYEETEEEPIKKQIIFNEDSHNENSGGICSIRNIKITGTNLILHSLLSQDISSYPLHLKIKHIPFNKQQSIFDQLY